MTDKLDVVTAHANTFGYMKRADLGDKYTDVLEAPDGQLYAVPRGQQPMKAKLKTNLPPIERPK